MTPRPAAASIRPRFALAALAACAAALAIAWPLAAQPRVSLMEEVGKDNLPAQKLGVDDLVAVSVYDAPELTRTVRVEQDGTIHLPLLQRGIQAAGNMPRQLETGIVQALKAEQILIDPIVKVTVVEYHSRPISVVGAVHKPVVFQAVGSVTLLDALARAEGLTTEAGTTILLTRSSGDVVRIPVHQLMHDADPSLNFALHGGEEIRVPEAEKIFVVGNVRKPGAFPVRNASDATVLEMVALSEGLLPYASKVAYVYRKDGSPVRQEIPVPLQKILDRKSPDVPLRAGDLLYIPDNKGRRLTAGVIDRITNFGSSTASGFLIWH
jgi:polysaccharide biosynthesis/export protein